MRDVSGGKERVRIWPGPRGKPKTEAQRKREGKFRGANLATKFISPQQALDFRNAVEGTPLLPRDLMISMFYGRLAAFELDDGRTLYPMAAKLDVSEALDAINQEPGRGLIRGPTLWEPYDPQELQPLTLRSTVVIGSPTPAVEWLGAGDYSRLAIVIAGVTASVSSNRSVQVGTAGGAVFHTGATDYHNILATGVDNLQSSMLLHSTASTGARSAAMVINNNINGQLKLCQPMPIPQLSYFDVSLDKIQALRVINFGGGNLNAGTVYFFGGH
jgi:hypothetical protein